MPGQTSYDKFIPILIIVLATGLVYSRVFWHEFLAYDDSVNIYENPYVIRGTVADFLHFWKTPYEKLYIPVTYNFWALLAKAAQWLPPDAKGRLNPGLFHAANLLIHLLNTLLVQAILGKLLKERRAALVGALFFALHPVQVAPVAWISEFRGLLSAFWGLLALHQYLRHCESDNPERRRYSYYLWASGFFLLALLSKPTAMVVAAMAGLAGYLILERPLRRLVRELSPWFLLALAAILLTRYAQPDAPYPFKPIFGQRLLIGGDALSFYLYQILLPLRLGPDYGRTPLFVLAHGWIWFTGIAPYLLAALLLRYGRRSWLFAAGIFLAGLLPTLGFISFDFQRISTVADRFLYLAMLGPAFAVGMLFVYCRGRRVRFLLLMVLVLLGVRSFIQVGYWKNGFILYAKTLQINHRSWLAHNNLGVKYLRNGEPEKAVALLEKAIEIRPRYAQAYNNLGRAKQELGQTKEAMRLYRKALALAPNSQLVLVNLGRACQDTGDYHEALSLFQRAVVLDPDFAAAHNDLGLLYCQNGKPIEAAAAFERAIEFKPDDAAAYNNLGKLKTDMGHPEEGVPLLKKALSLNDRFAEAAFNLGVAYEKLAEDTLADRAFQNALRIRPDYDLPWLGLGNLHRKAQRPQQAVAAYNQAVVANPELIDAYLELTDLYLSLGQAEEAAEVLDRMPEIDPDFSQAATQRLDQLRQRLGLPPRVEEHSSLDTVQESTLP